MAASARWLASANRWVESPGFTNRPDSPTEVAFADWSEFLDHAQEWLGTPPADSPTNFGDLIDRYDPATGFTAMERITGWHAGIMAEFIARGQVAPGVWPMERAIRASTFVEAARARGFDITVRWENA